jgi:drug/metabolite transporter (DMT)-like permease
MPLVLMFLLTLGSIWGMSISTAKLAVSAFGPIPVVFWYSLIAFVVLAAFSLWRGKPPPLDARHLKYYLVSGLLGFAIPSINNVVVVQYVPAGILSTVIATAPVFTYAIAMAVGQERFGWVRASGIAMGTIGALVIVLPKESLPDASAGWWVLLGLLTPFLYGISAVVISRYMPKETDSPTLAAGFLGVATLFYGVVMLAGGYYASPMPPVWPGSYMVLWLGVSSSLGYVLYFQIIRMAGAVYLSQVSYLVVTIGVSAGMILFGEHHSVWVWLGIALMVGGLTLVNFGQFFGKPADGRR